MSEDYDHNDHNNHNDNEETISIPYNETNMLCTKKDIQDICGNYGVSMKVNDIELYRMWLCKFKKLPGACCASGV